MDLFDWYLEFKYPYLRTSGYKITSPRDKRYNCIAWVVGDNTRWWDPDKDYYWPDRIPRVSTLTNFIKLFKYYGYENSDKSSIETGYEKIALYIDNLGDFSHVCKQLPSGRWTSKLGNLQDIEHNSLEAFNKSGYGIVAKILKRKTK